MMQITFINPFSKAWERMKKALFQPFDIHKWFILGFTAFLAGLVRGNPTVSFLDISDLEKMKSADFERIPEKVIDWTHAHPFLFMLILTAIFFGIILALILTWLSSRGAFMFLDNVVGDRAQVTAPWRQFGYLGNSLFLWRLGFGLICLLLTLPLAILSFLMFVPLLRGHNSGAYLLPFMGFLVVGLLIFLIVSYISLFANNFVVPIMYKYNLRVMAAWSQFIPILKSHPLSFVCYGLFLLILFTGVIIALIFAICFTCCLLIILLLIPYISSVALLPITYTYRAFSLEFLAQFGPEYTLFPVPKPPLPEPMIPDSNPAPAASA
jgi:hypothetical protein